MKRWPLIVSVIVVLVGGGVALMLLLARGDSMPMYRVTFGEHNSAIYTKVQKVRPAKPTVPLDHYAKSVSPTIDGFRYSGFVVTDLDGQMLLEAVGRSTREGISVRLDTQVFVEIANDSYESYSITDGATLEECTGPFPPGEYELTIVEQHVVESEASGV